MSSGSDIFRSSWSAGLRPDPLLTVSEWADLYRELDQASSPEPGRWHTSRTPYLREIMDCLSPSSPMQNVVFMSGTQLGKTEAGNNWLGYIIHQAPGPILYVQPTVEAVTKTSKQRIQPMLDACPALRERVREARSRDSGNTLLAKEFPGGILLMTGSNSSIGLRSTPVRYLFMDEVDVFERDVDEQGDPVELARRRTSNFKRNRKIFLVSSPTIKDSSRIERAFMQTDQRYYHVPCPLCGAFQRIIWHGSDEQGDWGVTWDHDDPAGAYLVCEYCRGRIEETHKSWMLERGQWVATADGDGISAGFHLSALYSPLGWYSWGEAAEAFLKAKGDPLEMKVFVNTILGESFQEQGEAANEEDLISRVEVYPERVPRGALVLVCGADVQDNRIELEVVGVGPGEESWGIDYRVIWGDPGRDQIWKDLDLALHSAYPHQDGYRLPISCTCIDSGGHYTQQVYRFCRGKQPRRIFAVKGFAGAGRPIVAAPKRARTGTGQRHLDLFQVGTDQARGLILSRLKVEQGFPGYCHWPSGGFGYDQEYFSQLSSMKCVTKFTRGVPRREWVLIPHRRKEAFDCRVYALAALYILNPAWEALAANRARLATRQGPVQRTAEPPPGPEDPPSSDPRPRTPPRPPPPPRRPSRSWINSWRY